MKKRFFYASMAFATLIGMTACSKDESVAPVENKIVDELTIEIDGSTASRVTSSGEGNENAVNNVTLFVKTASSSGGSDAKYKRYDMPANQNQLTVKYAQANSTVYAVANGFLKDLSSSPFETDPYSGVDGNKTSFDENVAGGIKKKYVGELTSAGSFLMSGRAQVVSGKNQERLQVQMKRDVAKVSFVLQNVEKEYSGDSKFYRPKQDGPTGLVVKRSTQKVQQFLMSGSGESGFKLDIFKNYKEDYPAKVGVEPDLDAKFDTWEQILTKKNINIEKLDGNDGQTSTDYTFAYEWGKVKTEEGFIFNNFYVLPNYAETKKESTIIILATKVQSKSKGKAAPPAAAWEDVSGDSQGLRYYKARISGGLEAFATEKNKHYKIVASLNGPGSASISDAMKEDTENDLYISLKVQDWDLVVSNQNIQ